MRYEDVVNTIKENQLIQFKEYTLDRHEHKRLAFEIDSALVVQVIRPSDSLDIITLERYYGEGLEEETYLQLSKINSYRYVLNIGFDQVKGSPIYKVIEINKDFINLGLQEITVILKTSQQHPVYVDLQKGLF